MKHNIITKELLDIYDKYDNEFGLLEEPWASKCDRQKVTSEQAVLLEDYIYSQRLIKNVFYSDQLKEEAIKRIIDIEKVMDIEVIAILRDRNYEKIRSNYRSFFD